MYSNYPLHLAAMYSNFPDFGPTQHTISRLLSSGADPTRLNADGRTPASYARKEVRKMFALKTNAYENKYVKNKKQLSFDYVIRFNQMREDKLIEGKLVQHKLTTNSIRQFKHYLNKEGLTCADTMDGKVLILMITASNSTLRSHAEKLSLKLPVLGRRKNAAYETEKAWVYEPLRSREKIQIIKAIIDKEFDLNVFKHGEIVLDYFPIHEETELEGIRDSWIRGCCPDPWRNKNHLLSERRSSTMSGLSRIATYFGEEKAMYFGFVSFYSLYLAYYIVIPGCALCLYQGKRELKKKKH